MRRRTVGTIRLVVLLVLGGGDAYDGDCGDAGGDGGGDCDGDGNCCFGADNDCAFDIFFKFLRIAKTPLGCAWQERASARTSGTSLSEFNKLPNNSILLN